MTTTEIKRGPTPGNPGVGYAVADKNGDVLIRTVSDTERAAKVNWLIIYAGCRITEDWSDRQIAETFALQSRDLGARLIRVRVVPENAP